MKRSSSDKTTITTKEEIKTPTGYKIITTKSTHKNGSWFNVLDAFADLFRK